jgi:hypothetical protein
VKNGKQTFDYQLKYSSPYVAQKRILAPFDPEYDEEGKMKNAMCCMYDYLFKPFSQNNDRNRIPLGQQRETEPNECNEASWCHSTSQETDNLIAKPGNCLTGKHLLGATIYQTSLIGQVQAYLII